MISHIPRIAVFGSVNQDLIAQVTRLPQPGETILGASLERLPGGKGANQAVAAARAGASVEFIGCFGEEEAGTNLRQRMREENIALTASLTTSDPQSLAVILVDDQGENVIIVTPGSNENIHVTDAATSVIRDANILMCQLEVPLDAIVSALHAARAHDVVTVVNFSPIPADSYPQELLDLADVVIVNEGEAHYLGDRLTAVSHAVTTLGAQGAHYRGKDGEYRVSSLPLQPVDTTGCGDVFAGVFAAFWHRGAKEALRRAAVAGSLATQLRGAGDCAPTASDIEKACATQSEG